MKNVFFISFIFFLVSCGKDSSKSKTIIASGTDTTPSITEEHIYVALDLNDLEPGLVCATGGVSIFTFMDKSGDSLYDSDESILKVKTVCNGLNGSNGSVGQDGTNGSSSVITLEAVVSSEICPNGGVKISSSTGGTVEVCNGVNGLNGEQGLPGVAGLPGMNGIDGNDGENGIDGQDGEDGAGVNPVRFCSVERNSSTSYGLLIDGELFIVSRNGSSKNTSLVKLNANDYQNNASENCIQLKSSPSEDDDD
jgi:hypothetical protein